MIGKRLKGPRHEYSHFDISDSKYVYEKKKQDATSIVERSWNHRPPPIVSIWSRVQTGSSNLLQAEPFVSPPNEQ